jgi:signal peptidase I
MTFFVKQQSLKVHQSCMEPNIFLGDRIIASPIKRSSQIKRNDKVIFIDNVSKDLVLQRIIGLPGDKLKIVKGETFINNILFTFNYKIMRDSSNFGPKFIPANQYFLMGDNRSVSEDSRKTGLVLQENILFKVRTIYWPISHALRFFCNEILGLNFR